MMCPAFPFARLRLARAALPLLLLAVAACGAERAVAVAPPASLTDVQRHSLHIGLDLQVPDSAMLARVVAARFTQSGDVVVLDGVAPFVKVFDARGRFLVAFGKEGEGPGEMRRPAALAVSGDSLVLVADSRTGLTMFDLQGRVRAHTRVEGLVTLAAAAPCAGEWVLYGPRFDRDGSHKATWLHRLRLDERGETQVHDLLRDTVPGMVSVGLPYGLVADGGAAVGRHSRGGEPLVFRLPCGADQVQVLKRGEPQRPHDPERDGEGHLRASVRPGMRAPAGVAALDGTVAFAEKVIVRADVDRMELTYLRRDGERTFAIAGDYILHDSRPGLGVLLSTGDPVPQVFVLPSADFMQMLERS